VRSAGERQRAGEPALTAIVTVRTTAQLSVMSDDTHVPFSSEEVRMIRQTLGDQDKPTVCPVCGSELKVSGEAGQSVSMPLVQRVECVPCSRGAIIVGGRWADPDK
jgi:hypothetical protein